jgi:hypothetical protein
MQQASQHFSVVDHGGGSQMSQGVGQVGVDPVWREFAGLPWKPANEHLQLLQVSGGSTDPVVVQPGQLNQGHVAPPKSGIFGRLRHGWSPSQNPHNLNFGQLAQLNSCPRLLALCERVEPILKAAYLACLAACLWLHQLELCLGLVAVGQFRKAFKRRR